MNSVRRTRFIMAASMVFLFVFLHQVNKKGSGDIYLAEKHYLKGDFHRAYQVFSDYFLAHPDSMKAMQRLGETALRIFRTEGNKEFGRRAIGLLVELHSRTRTLEPSLLLETALAARDLGENPQAQKALLAYLEATRLPVVGTSYHQDRARALYTLGFIALEENRFDSAEYYHSVILKLEATTGRWPLVHRPLFLSRLAAARGDLTSAHEELERGLADFPTDPFLFNELYLITLRNGDFQGAEKIALRERAIDPRGSTPLCHLANALNLQGRFREAEGLLESQPTAWNAETYYLLGHAKNRLGQPSEALKFFQKGLERVTPASPLEKSLRERISELTTR